MPNAPPRPPGLGLCPRRLGLLLLLVLPRRSAGTNVLVFLADDLGYGDLASYGHPTSETPALDALAARGLRFTQFYSASPVCSPARAAVLTGRLPARNGVYCANGTSACASPEQPGCCNGVFLPGKPGGLPLSERTFATALQAAGWNGTSGAIGKWHLGMQQFMPTAGHGFDYYYGVPHGVGACPCAACFAPDETCSIPCSPTWAPCPVFENTTIVQQPADLLTLSAQYVRAAQGFIERAVARSAPFLLYYCSHHVHSPQFAGADATNTTQRGRFGDSLKEFDAAVGSLLRTLDRLGVADDTLVWMTSDNGPSMRNEVRGGNAGLLRCGKGTTYEGGQRVPALVSWPAGGLRAGVVCRRTVSTLDMFPTILRVLLPAAALPAAENGAVLDGYDVLPLLRSSCAAPSPRAGRLVYYPQFARRDRGLYAVSVRTRAGSMSRTKVHFHTEGSLQSGEHNRDRACRPTATFATPEPPLAFDLGMDPSEMYPLPAGHALDSAVRQAQGFADAHAAGMVWYPWPQLNNGSFDPHLWPCAQPGCEPFPSCCVTNINPI